MKHLSQLVVACALAGCAANGATHPSGDGGQGSDLGASSDAAAPSDLGFFSNDLGIHFGIALRDPSPLASRVATNASLRFDVTLAGATQSNVEQWLQVLKRGTTTPLTGAFAWSAGAMPGQSSLLFLPSTSFVDLTDYVVHVDDPRAFPSAVLRTGFTTGSHPRVIAVDVTPAAVAFAFSEDMDPVTVQFATTVLLDMVVIAGGAAQTTDARHYAYTFSTAQSASGTLAVRVATTATSAVGTTALDAKSWDSATVAADGAFELDFPNVAWNATPSWTPTVN